jgi:uncharacterized protein YeeX (DUF496 family)
MGVDVNLICFVGIKGGYNEFLFVKNSADKQLEYYNVEDYNNVVYTEYLPDEYLYITDGMGGEYSLLGKKIFVLENLYDYVELNLSPESVQEIKQVVIRDFKDLKLNFDEKDVKLHIIQHCS